MALLKCSERKRIADDREGSVYKQWAVVTMKTNEAAVAALSAPTESLVLNPFVQKRDRQGLGCVRRCLGMETNGRFSMTPKTKARKRAFTLNAISFCIVGCASFSMFMILGFAKEALGMSVDWFVNYTQAVRGKAQAKCGCSCICRASFIYLRNTILIGLALVPFVLSPLCVLVKLSQVSFVGIAPDDWTVDQWIQFAGTSTALGSYFARD